jgi:hypothetical protein
MPDYRQQEGVMVTLMHRFKHQRLPRILAIKAQVDQGHRLGEYDRVFLEEVMQDAQRNIRQVEDIPECQHMFIQLVGLYKEIIDRAVENEKHA